MKIKIVLLIMFVGTSMSLEREQEAGVVENQSTGGPVEETTEQIPVTSVRSLEGDEEESGTDNPGQDAQCSPHICGIKCRMNGCFESECLDDGRCRCFCRRYVDPFENFFKSILSSHLEPGLTVRMRPFGGFPSFGFPHRDNVFPDLHKLFEEMGNKSEGAISRVYFTLQQTCQQEDDCSAVCSNCTATQCVDNFCQCSGCNREGVDSRSTNVVHTCRTARNCIEHCKGCVKTTCRYGVCECGQCSAQETPEDTTTISSTTSTTTTTESSNESEIPTAAAEILAVRDNQTVPDIGHRGKCVPKRCNHSCWERQCSKWNCVDDRCECEGCPEEVAVIVKNGEAQKAQENNKYEIIF